MAGFRMPDKGRVFLICLALPVFTFIVYEPVLHHEFIGFDDHTYVTGNQQVKAGLTHRDTALSVFAHLPEESSGPCHSIDCCKRAAEVHHPCIFPILFR